MARRRFKDVSEQETSINAKRDDLQLRSETRRSFRKEGRIYEEHIIRHL